MRFKEIQVRTGMFAVVFAAMLWGYQLMLTSHLPSVFNDTLEDMSYGWYIPLFSLYVVWRERKDILATVGAPSAWGLVLAVPCLFAGFLGVRGIQVRLEIVGFVGLLFGLVWTFFGRRTAVRVIFPIGFLLFCMPLHTYLDIVTIHLRMLAVSIAQGTLEGCGIDVLRQGTMLASPTGAFSIDVAEPCSGMRSLFAMMALTAAYSYFTQSTWFRRGFLFALSIPIAVLGNVARVLSIVLVAATCSSDFAMGFYHDYSGYIVFLVAILLMVATGSLITKGAEKCASS